MQKQQQRSDGERRKEDIIDMPKAKPSESKQETEDLLDEIDDLLEENAEAFVTGFIQKSGE